MTRIILASGSQSRRKLLKEAGVSFVVKPSDVDESVLAKSGGTPREIAARLARAKADDVAGSESDALVIGADQTLDLDGALMTKAANMIEARRHLAAMAGRTHQLHSAFSVVRNGRQLARCTRSVRLAMRKLTDADVDWYLEEAGEGILSSVGCYQLEGLGVRLFDRIDGDYFTILGLPMIPLLGALRRLGAIAR